MGLAYQLDDEWLEADGLGGYASGTVAGYRTRRYHALLLVATTPPTGRMVLVNGLEVWVETPAGRFALSSQHYAPDVIHPDGASRIDEFTIEPWPRWVYTLAEGAKIEQQFIALHGRPATIARWRLLAPQRDIKLFVRPLLSGRDYHALHHENPAFRHDAIVGGCRVTWHPYEGVPGITCDTTGAYRHAPQWYRNFLYQRELERGLDATEDLASPGAFEFDLAAGEAACIFSTEAGAGPASEIPSALQRQIGEHLAAETQRRAQFATPLERAADAYIVTRHGGRTIVAGYPWFTDWGRDTFIALRGLCLATGRLDVARDILLAWAGTVSEGMLPNRFPDFGDQPEFNAVDASLWFIVAVHDYLAAAAEHNTSPADDVRSKLIEAVTSIVHGYQHGTRYGIRTDDDGLLAAGVPGVQLTWMDAKVGDWVVTPRIGKPVEVQALWANALWIAAQLTGGSAEPYERTRRALIERFWNEERACLFDVVDVDHQHGVCDTALRPNQVLAVGGLPRQLIEGEQALAIVTAAEERLLTPRGLRSLAPGEPGYVGTYGGGPRQRDGAYHQGIVWPWLLGPFVESWVRVHGATPAIKAAARERFLAPLFEHLREAGLGHVSEIADSEAPFTPRGCPWQAWSLGELLRLDRQVLAP